MDARSLAHTHTKVVLCAFQSLDCILLHGFLLPSMVAASVSGIVATSRTTHPLTHANTNTHAPRKYQRKRERKWHSDKVVHNLIFPNSTKLLSCCISILINGTWKSQCTCSLISVRKWMWVCERATECLCLCPCAHVNLNVNFSIKCKIKWVQCAKYTLSLSASGFFLLLRGMGVKPF